MPELKEQALLERLGELTVQYENKIADLRVELTNYANKAGQLEKELRVLRQQLDAQRGPEVVEGEVVPQD